MAKTSKEQLIVMVCANIVGSEKMLLLDIGKSDKRPNGHIAHLRNQFKSTHDYIISLIKRRKYPLFSLWKLKGYCSSFDQTWIPFTQGCFVPSLIEIGPVILEKKIFKFRQFILLFRSHLPLKKGIALHLNKHEYSSPKDALYQIWLNLAQWILKFHQCIFAIS